MLVPLRRTPSVHAPSLFLLLPGLSYVLAGSMAHDVAVGWIGLVLTVITTAGLAWMRWSVKTVVKEQVDAEVKRQLEELGLIDPRHHRR